MSEDVNPDATYQVTASQVMRLNYDAGFDEGRRAALIEAAEMVETYAHRGPFPQWLPRSALRLAAMRIREVADNELKLGGPLFGHLPEPESKRSTR